MRDVAAALTSIGEQVRDMNDAALNDPAGTLPDVQSVCRAVDSLLVIAYRLEQLNGQVARRLEVLAVQPGLRHRDPNVDAVREAASVTTVLHRQRRSAETALWFLQETYRDAAAALAPLSSGEPGEGDQ